MHGEEYIRLCQLHDSLVHRQLLQNDIVVRVLRVTAPPFSDIIEKNLIDALDQLVMVENQSECGSSHNSQLQLVIPAVWRVEVHVRVGGCPKPVCSKKSPHEGPTANRLPVAEEGLWMRDDRKCD